MWGSHCHHRVAVPAEERCSYAQDDTRQALMPELEEAQYEVTLVSRRYEAVDPAKRLVARELESRWSARSGACSATSGALDSDDRAGLLALARDLTSVSYCLT